MIIVAIILVAVATILIAADFVRQALANAFNLGTLGLAFLSGGVLAYLLYVADEAGKL